MRFLAALFPALYALSAARRLYRDPSLTWDYRDSLDLIGTCALTDSPVWSTAIESGVKALPTMSFSKKVSVEDDGGAESGAKSDASQVEGSRREESEVQVTMTTPMPTTATRQGASITATTTAVAVTGRSEGGGYDKETSELAQTETSADATSGMVPPTHHNGSMGETESTAQEGGDDSSSESRTTDSTANASPEATTLAPTPKTREVVDKAGFNGTTTDLPHTTIASIEESTPSSDVVSSSSSTSATSLTSVSPRPSGKSKYNYASPDCGARVHASSKLSQHASGVLHKSRDRYMLTPCKTDEHWVTIELCDEIRIDAVEIAVWEYFSGVVREIKVTAGIEEDGEMDEVASFVGRNVRGVQTFTLPTPTSFYRFIRLDFPSFYGSEFYCPVSQIKVYGMNQLEAFKWEQKQKEDPTPRVPAADRATNSQAASDGVSDSTRQSADNASNPMSEREAGELEKLVQEAARRQPLPTPTPEEVLNNTDVTKRRSDSESIYAFITRRLADLEGNSTLVARYIDEQTRAMRRAQVDLYDWRSNQEAEDARRWERERMRQEDRLGRILSQLETQRAERVNIEAQLRVLSDQISYERRRGLAQLGILMVVIAIGVSTRSETIEMLLKPILAEARRKRGFSMSMSKGKGMSVDTTRANAGIKKAGGAGRDVGSAALVSGATAPTGGTGGLVPGSGRDTGGQGHSPGQSPEVVSAMTTSISTGLSSSSLVRSDSGRRHSGMTPTRRRGPRPDHHHLPRTSLPARYTPKKLARTAHLHAMVHPPLEHSVSSPSDLQSETQSQSDVQPRPQPQRLFHPSPSLLSPQPPTEPADSSLSSLSPTTSPLSPSESQAVPSPSQPFPTWGMDKL